MAAETGTTNADRRIAVVLPSLGGGGAERMMVNLCHGLTERRRQVRMVVVGGQAADSIPTGSLDVVFLGCSRMMLALPALRRELDRFAPAAVISTIAHGNVLTAAAVAGIRPRPRLVLREATNVARRFADSATRLERLLPGLQAIAYRRADAVVAVSEGVADDLRRWVRVPDHKLRVIANPVITPALGQMVDHTPDHPWLQNRTVPVAIAVGRLRPEKDFQTLIRALQICRRHRELRAIILGEGSQRAELEALIGDLGLVGAVDLPGFASNPYCYMAQADVFVLSSRFEGSPNALVEAIACGCPVVATDCHSGPREILSLARAGVLVDVGEPEAMAEAILHQLDGREDRGGYLDVIEAYGLESVTRDYESVLLGSESESAPPPRRS